MQEAKFRILLPTYNGEKYLRAQIESILAQTEPHWQLILSDDGSADGTLSVIREFAAKDARIIPYESGTRFGSAQGHFLHLLQHFSAGAAYILFCDQDDVWHSDKIARTMTLMQSVEAGRPDRPAFVHTDLRVVDERGTEIAPSFWAFSGFRGGRLALRQLLVQNTVSGCSMMCNGALCRMAVSRPIPTAAVRMHDWWLALLGSCFACGALPVATSDYRQHGHNAVGAKNVHNGAYLWTQLKSREMHRAMQATYEQATAFLACYGDLLPESAQETLRQFSALCDAGKLRRWKILISGGFWKQGTARRVGQLLWG